MILIIDNYDSFTYNLVQLIGGHTRDYEVIRNDRLTVADILRKQPKGILLSPGPGRPEQAGICVELIRSLPASIPLLGVCLGHQAIGFAFGGSIIHAPRLMHGKTSPIIHHQKGIFRDVPSPFDAARYHSLVIDPGTLPKELMITARTDDDIIMGIRHTIVPIEGIQFHPESILTPAGPTIITNWLTSVGANG
jgi:anthranilate synthase/aminodeoxychorismate synthase-like glutamine amidotransferase